MGMPSFDVTCSMVKSLLNNLVFTQFTPLESPIIYGGDIEKNVHFLLWAWLKPLPF
jgi:hypothetical protein